MSFLKIVNRQNIVQNTKMQHQQNNFCVSSNLKAQVPCPIISHVYQLVTNAVGHQMITKWLPSGHQNVHQLVNDVTMISLVYQVVTREAKEELERRFEEIVYKINKWRVQEKKDSKGCWFDFQFACYFVVCSLSLALIGNPKLLFRHCGIQWHSVAH